MMENRNQVISKVLEIISRVCKINDMNNPLSIKIKDLETSVSDYLIVIIMDLEDEYNFIFEDNEIDAIDTIGDIVNIICNKLRIE